MSTAYATLALEAAEKLLMATCFDESELALRRAGELWRRAVEGKRVDLRESDSFHRRSIRLAMDLKAAKRVFGGTPRRAQA